MPKSTLQTPKGFRDFLPEEKRRRDFVMGKIKQVFEVFGFEPLETPTLEYASVLLGKYGKEADKMVYTFQDKGKRNLALKYDQTVPSARVLAQYQNQLPKFFRRYQIQNVFRADKPQKGRYREFTQCDIDIFGSPDPLADAEIVACTYFVFKNIGYPNITLRLNDRKILFEKLEKYATKKTSTLSIIQTIDKLDKKSKEEVLNELAQKGISRPNAEKVLQDIKTSQPTENLNKIIEYSKNLGVPEKSLKFSPTLARGLDYYTGMIFEVIIPEYPVGSFGGGGRYDNLIKQLSGIDIPAVGIAYGFDRLVEAATELKLIPSENIGTQVLITCFDKNSLKNSLSAAQKLRQQQIPSEVYPSIEPLPKQLKYANKKGVPFVLIIGPNETKANQATLKNMKTGQQETLPLDKVIKKLK